MNQIVNTLISAIGFSRRDRAAIDLNSGNSAPMVELQATQLGQIVGGDGEDNGPRGGWKAVSSSLA